MVAYKTIQYGSKGDDVKTLQKLLNENGYSLSVDGIYGEKTQSAVKQYQNGNRLTVDGIVGKNTWASLTGGASNGRVDVNSGTDLTSAQEIQSGSSQSSLLQQYESNWPQYTPSSALATAETKLSAHEASQPGAYVSAYDKTLETLYDQIMNRGEFSYDPSEDPLYERYKDKYVSGGQLAMQDTMANLASLTSGYGNTYAQMAGQQQMDAYMTSLADILPQMEENAYSRWMDEGKELYDRFVLTQRLETENYERYRDSVDDYYEELEYLYGNYHDTYDSEYERYLDEVSAWQKDRAYYYEKAMDELALAGRSSSSGYSLGKSSSAAKNAETGNTSSASNVVKKITTSLGTVTDALREKYDTWMGMMGDLSENASAEDTSSERAGTGSTWDKYLLPEEVWANENGEEEYEELLKRMKKN